MHLTRIPTANVSAVILGLSEEPRTASVGERRVGESAARDPPLFRVSKRCLEFATEQVVWQFSLRYGSAASAPPPVGTKWGQTMGRSRKAQLVSVIAGLAAVGCSAPSATNAEYTPGDGEPTLAEVRSLNERFQDVEIALAEGYVRDPMDMCETAEMMGRPAADGAMGVHYFRPDLLGVTAPPSPRVNGDGTHTDFRTPAVLIYEPQADGSMELVAVENLVFAEAWRANDADPPTFHGLPFDFMADDPTTALDEAHMFEPHFDRHVWVYRENPNGVFNPFNPAVTCEHHTGATAIPMH